MLFGLIVKAFAESTKLYMRIRLSFATTQLIGQRDANREPTNNHKNRDHDRQGSWKSLLSNLLVCRSLLQYSYTLTVFKSSSAREIKNQLRIEGLMCVGVHDKVLTVSLKLKQRNPLPTLFASLALSRLWWM